MVDASVRFLWVGPDATTRRLFEIPKPVAFRRLRGRFCQRYYLLAGYSLPEPYVAANVNQEEGRP